MRPICLFLMLLIVVVPAVAQDTTPEPAPVLPDNLEPITAANVHRLTELARYGDGVLGSALAWSPDGTKLAVAGSLGVWVYDAAFWNDLPQLIDVGDEVRQVAYSGDGRQLVYLTAKEAIVIDTVSKTQLLRIPDVSAIATGSTTSLLATAKINTSSAVQVIELWDLRTLTTAFTYPITYNGYIEHLIFNPDESYLVAGLRGYSYTTCGFLRTDVYLLDIMARDVQPFAVLEAMENPVFSPDGRYIAAAEQDAALGATGVVVLWNASDHTQHLRLSDPDVPEGSWNTVRSSDFNPVDATFSALIGDFLLTWNSSDGELLTRIPVEQQLQQIRYSRDGHYLVGVSREALSVWQNFAEAPLTIPLSNALLDLQFSADGSMFRWRDEANHLHLWQLENLDAHEIFLSSAPVTSNNIQVSQTGDVVVFDQDDGLHIWTAQTAAATSVYTRSMAWQLSKSGNVLAYLTADGMIHLRPTRQDAALINLQQFFPSHAWLRISPDGRWLITVVNNQADESERETELILWDVTTGEAAKNLGIYRGSVELKFSDDSTRLAISAGYYQSGDRHHLTRVYDLNESIGEVLFEEEGLVPLVFTPDFNTFIRVGGNYASTWLEVFDTATNTPLFADPIHDFYGSSILGFSADSQFMVLRVSSHTNCGGDSRTVRVFSLKTKQEVRNINLSSGHAVTFISFSPNSNLLVVSDASRLTILDTDNGQTVIGWPIFNGSYAQFHSDSRLLLIGGADGTVRVYGVPTS